MSTLTPQTITAGGQSFSLFKKFNLKLFLYIIFALLVEIAAIVYGLKAPLYLAVAIFVPLSLYIFVVYGFQWFGINGFLSNKIVEWPPTLNSCPDFLVSYIVPKSGAIPALPGCVDTIGIGTKPASFPKANAEGKPINFTPPTAPVTKSTAANYHPNGWFAVKTGESIGELCQRLKDTGLTWEGVWDGNTCYSSGSDVLGGLSASGETNCPSGV